MTTSEHMAVIENGGHTIFLSYASADRDRVLPYNDWLLQAGFHTWIDCRSIKPGQNWDFEIKRALERCSLVVAFISEHSVNRRGYVQRELKLALDKLSEQLIDDIYIVPVLLDPSIPVPDQLKAIQSISAADEQCKQKISEALTYQLGRLGVRLEQTQRCEDLYWSSSTLHESRDGLPGYEFNAQLLSFTSQRYANVPQIGEYVRGRLLDSLFEHRSGMLSQLPESFNYGQDSYRRTNTYDAHCSGPSIKGRVVSIQYAVHWYGAGAAHPNHHFETFSFLLHPVTLIRSLAEIFLNPETALSLLQEKVRAQLAAVRLDDGTNEDSGLDKGWIDRGTSSWKDFGAFVFGQENVQLLFAPYQVASYACGAQLAEVTYADIATELRPEFCSALELEHLRHR